MRRQRRYRWAPDNFQTYVSHGPHLLCSRPCAPGDDCARMPHPSSGRCRLSGDEGDYRLSDVLAHEGRSVLFCRTTDFPNHDDGFCLGIGLKQLQGINEARPDQWIAADSNARGLSDAPGGQLMDSLIGERPRCARRCRPGRVYRHREG